MADEAQNAPAQERTLMFSDGVNGDAVLERRDNGTALLKNLAVFRTGSFADSTGNKATWTSAHLEAMVSNFNELKNSVMKNVPWRTNHPTERRDVNEVVGYYAGVRTDGTTLFADVELTEPDAVDRWERGTYRERSIELGAFKVEDKVKWPVITGTAFVDRGALSFSAADDDDKTAIYYMESQNMADAKKTDADVAKADADASAADDKAKADAKVDGDKKVLESAHSAPAPATFQFQGKEITEAEFQAVMAGAVQTEARLAALEETRKAEIMAGRHAFIDSLIEADQMFAHKRDDAVKLVDGLTDEQYASWQSLQAEAPKIGLFQSHVDIPVDEEAAAKVKASEFADERTTLEATVEFMSKGQMSREAIEKSEPYLKLQALKGDK